MPALLASGARVEIFDTLDSTSLEAKRRAAAGETGPLWLIALKQTSGYGRRGSEWVQREGDVAATLLFRADAPTEVLPQHSFVAALAVADAVAHYAPEAKLSLKWPNDVLALEAKLAGILLELIDSPERPCVALGVGVNIVSAPEGLDYPAARLIDHSRGKAPHPAAFVETLDACFSAWLRRWRIGGFSPIRSEWLRRAAGRGRTIRVRLPEGVVEGLFKDLDQTGALILDCRGQRLVVAAGAVMPRER